MTPEDYIRSFVERWIKEHAADKEVDAAAMIEASKPADWRTLNKQQQLIALARIPMRIAVDQANECSRRIGECAELAATFRELVEEEGRQFLHWMDVAEKAAVYASSASDEPRRLERERLRKEWKAGGSCGHGAGVCYECAKTQPPTRDSDPIEDLLRARDRRVTAAHERQVAQEKQARHQATADVLRAEAPRKVTVEGRSGGITVRVDGLDEEKARAVLTLLRGATV